MARKPLRRKPTPKKPAEPVWQRGFLTALSLTGNVRLACESADVHKSTVYARRDDDELFSLAFAQARDDAADRLEEEARRRAVEGVVKLKFHEGTPIMVPGVNADGTPAKNAKGEPIYVPYVEHEYSDTLLIFLLKGARPEKYRENHKHEHTGAVAQVIVYRPEKDPYPEA